MQYEGVLYRPPSESQSLLMQLTVGCSYNKCTYCAMYDEVEYRLKPIETVLKDVEEAGLYRFKRIFLCDGDALIAPQKYLVRVLEAIREKMPFVERLGIYGDCRSILKKKPAELEKLRDLGLGIIYHGIESGDNQTLKAIRKGTTAEQTIEAGKRVIDAGIQYSAIVMMGIAGRERSQIHAAESARVLNAIQPHFIGLLTTMVIEGTAIYDLAEAGSFVMPSRLGLVEEMLTLLDNLEVKRGLLTSKHASNYLTLRVILPQEKHQAIQKLRKVIEDKDETILKPEFMRGL
jgi:radical SAM superfamily enzyme YgiQ (UPF0313 family)